MTITIRRRHLPWVALVPIVAVAAFVLAGGSNAAPKSVPLHGSMNDINHAVPPASCPSVLHICSQFVANGSFHGTGLVSVDTFPNAAQHGYSEAHTVITTNKGELHCNEAALFDLSNAQIPHYVHPFVDLCLIDGATSTGDYAGASGYIQEVGTFDFAAGVGSLDYYGQITYGN